MMILVEKDQPCLKIKFLAQKRQFKVKICNLAQKWYFWLKNKTFDSKFAILSNDCNDN